jgi:hypothetical protein
MALSDEIASLRDRVLTELSDAHDYYTDTKIAWRMVHKIIDLGQTFSIRKRATGTVVTQDVLRIQSLAYITGPLAEMTFQQFLSIFESFFFDLLRIWLTAYPGSLGKKMVDFKTILELPDKDAVTGLVVRKELTEILYDRPGEWFAYLEDKARLGCPTADEIERIAEAKAARDVLIHNMGIANKLYVSKAGSRARFREGERIDIPEDYHRETWELLRKVASDVTMAAIAKTS